MDTNTRRIERLRRSLTWLWVGPVGGLACMLALVCYGLAAGLPTVVMIASSVAAMLGGVWASTRIAVQRQLIRAEQ